MGDVWFVAALWALVGLAGVLIATWVGHSFREEVVKPRRKADARKPPVLELVRGGTSPDRRSKLAEFPAELMVMRGSRPARAAGRHND